MFYIIAIKRSTYGGKERKKKFRFLKNVKNALKIDESNNGIC